MQNYIQPGNFITIAASPYAVSSGDGVLYGKLFGVAAGDAAEGTEVVIAMVGVFTMAKVSAESIGVGAAIYWDDTAHLVTGVEADQLIGYSISAAANPSSTIEVRLNGFAL